MKYSKKRRKLCQHLQQWAENNLSDWLTICGVERKISKTEFHRLENLLYENKFDYIVLVLFTIHGYVFDEKYGDFRMAIMDTLIQVCKNKGIKLSKYPSFQEIIEKLSPNEEDKTKITEIWKSLEPKNENQ